MSKKISITPQISKQIQFSLGDNVFDTSNLAVYEARFISTEPVKKRGSIWEGGRMTPSVLREMENYINKEGNALPLHVMHETGLLPVGKVFSAKMFEMENGEFELLGQFYVPNTETEILNKIDSSVVDEVSIGVQPAQMLCSECGFDYLGEEADFENFFTRTCPEGHTIGLDGVHIRGVGLKSWDEVSLCGTGAANKAKILGQSKQRLSKENVNKLAASDYKSWQAGFVQLTFKQPTIKGEGKMSVEFTELKNDYTALVAEKTKLEVKLSEAEAKVAELEKEVQDKDKEVTEAKAEVEAVKAEADKGSETVIEEAKAEAKEAVEKAEAAEKEMLEASEKLQPHVKAALVAAGVAVENIPTKLSEMIDMIEKEGLKLHQTFGASKTDVTLTSDTDKDEARRKAAFKLNK